MKISSKNSHFKIKKLKNVLKCIFKFRNDFQNTFFIFYIGCSIIEKKIVKQLEGIFKF